MPDFHGQHPAGHRRDRTRRGGSSCDDDSRRPPSPLRHRATAPPRTSARQDLQPLLHRKVTVRRPLSQGRLLPHSLIRPQPQTPLLPDLIIYCSAQDHTQEPHSIFTGRHSLCCSVLAEQFRYVFALVVCCPVQRRAPLVVRSIDIGLVGNKEADGIHVAHSRSSM